jgi:cytochrome oxidase Cu insertion factor (SCO1/SenC/PrrC family)
MRIDRPNNCRYAEIESGLSSSFTVKQTVSPRQYLLLIIVVLVLLLASCTQTPPEGTPIDFSSARIFEPFKLKDLDGNERELKEFLSKATLVAFFFPT